MTPEQNKIPYIIKNKVTKSQYDNPANFSEAEREAHIFEITNSAGEVVEGKSFTYTDNEGAEHTVTAAVGAEIFNNYNDNVASGGYAHAEGFKTISIGEGSHTEGIKTFATANGAHAEGGLTKATGETSHAEGQQSLASGNTSHAEGFQTTASGQNSHSEGEVTIASGAVSHAEGSHTQAKQPYSHAEGFHSFANYPAQHVQGRWNVEDNSDLVHIQGWGSDENNRKNIHTIDKSGNAWFQGDIYVGSTGGKNKDDGSKKVITEAGGKIKGELEIDSSGEDYDTISNFHEDGLSIRHKGDVEAITNLDGYQIYMSWDGDDCTASYRTDGAQLNFESHSSALTAEGLSFESDGPTSRLDSSGLELDGDDGGSAYKSDRMFIVCDSDESRADINASGIKFATHKTGNGISHEYEFEDENLLAEGYITYNTTIKGDNNGPKIAFGANIGGNFGTISGLKNAQNNNEATPLGQVNSLISTAKSSLVPTSRKINNKLLTTDITLSAGDVGAYTKAETDSAITTAKNELLGSGQLVETYDTLQEIGTWIQNSGVDATELSKAIAAEAQTRAAEDAKKLDKTGGTITGDITINKASLTLNLDEGQSLDLKHHEDGITMIDGTGIVFDDENTGSARLSRTRLYIDSEDSDGSSFLNGDFLEVNGGNNDASKLTSTNLSFYQLDEDVDEYNIPTGTISGLVNATANDQATNLGQVNSLINTAKNSLVPTSRTINGKALSSNITLSAGDVSAYTKSEVDNKLNGKLDKTGGTITGKLNIVEDPEDENGISLDDGTFNANLNSSGLSIEGDGHNIVYGASGVYNYGDGGTQSRLTHNSLIFANEDGEIRSQLDDYELNFPNGGTVSGLRNATADDEAVPYGQMKKYADTPNANRVYTMTPLITAETEDPDGNKYTGAVEYETTITGLGDLSAGMMITVVPTMTSATTQPFITVNGIRGRIYTTAATSSAFFNGTRVDFIRANYPLVLVFMGNVSDTTGWKCLNSVRVNVEALMSNGEAGINTIPMANGANEKLVWRSHKDLMAIGEATYNSSTNTYNVTLPGIGNPSTGSSGVFRGIEITIIPNATNAQGAQISVNGGAAKDIQIGTGQSSVSSYVTIPADILKANMPTKLKYTGSAWRITDFILPHAESIRGQVSVANGGTGRSTLTSGYYLVGNGTSAVALKTKAQVLSDIGAVSTATYNTLVSQFNALVARVEALEAGGGNIKKFRISDDYGNWAEFNYRDGMTWYEFVESEFNTMVNGSDNELDPDDQPIFRVIDSPAGNEVVVIYGKGYIFDDDALCVGSPEAEDVYPESLISDYSQYYISGSYNERYEGEGDEGGEEYRFESPVGYYYFEEGMTWEDFIDSEHNVMSECGNCGEDEKFRHFGTDGDDYVVCRDECGECADFYYLYDRENDQHVTIFDELYPDAVYYCPDM